MVVVERGRSPALRPRARMATGYASRDQAPGHDRAGRAPAAIATLVHRDGAFAPALLRRNLVVAGISVLGGLEAYASGSGAGPVRRHRALRAVLRMEAALGAGGYNAMRAQRHARDRRARSHARARQRAVRGTAREGRDRRPAARAARRASDDRHGAALAALEPRAAPRQGEGVDRPFRRDARAARLAPRAGRGAAQGKPRRGDPAPRALAAGLRRRRFAGRPDVRRGHAADRRGLDGGRRGARARARVVRLHGLEAVRRRRIRGDARRRAGARPRGAQVAARGLLRRRRQRGRARRGEAERACGGRVGLHPPDAHAGREARPAGGGRGIGRGHGPRRGEPALWRAPGRSRGAEGDLRRARRDPEAPLRRLALCGHHQRRAARALDRPARRAQVPAHERRDRVHAVLLRRDHRGRVDLARCAAAVGRGGSGEEPPREEPQEPREEARARKRHLLPRLRRRPARVLGGVDLYRGRGTRPRGRHSARTGAEYAPPRRSTQRWPRSSARRGDARWSPMFSRGARRCGGEGAAPRSRGTIARRSWIVAANSSRSRRTGSCSR